MDHYGSQSRDFSTGVTPRHRESSLDTKSKVSDDNEDQDGPSPYPRRADSDGILRGSRNSLILDSTEVKPLYGLKEPVSKESEDEKITKQRVKNMAHAIFVVAVAMTGYNIYYDTYHQWLYAKFEEHVLGANFTKLNISIYRDPCLHTSSNHTSPLEEKLNKAQSMSANFSTWYMVVGLVPGLISNLVIGAYADKIGRRALFIVPLIGVIANIAITCAVAFFNLNLNVLYFGVALNGFGGTPITLYMGLYLYMADNTGRKKSRSVSMLLGQAVANIILAGVHLAVGYFIHAEGYEWPMFTGMMVIIVALIWVAVFLQETVQHTSLPKLKNLSEGIQGIFSFYLDKGNNPKYKRKDFIILGAVFFLFGACLVTTFRSMYLMNEPLCLSAKEIGYLSTFEGLIQSFGAIVVIHLLQCFLRDELICVVGLLSGAGCRIILAFSDQHWMVYLAFAVSMLENLSTPVIRAILSRMVPAGKRGSMFASVAVIEVITIAVSGAGANALYSSTVSIWRGLAYLVVACGVLVAAAIMTTYYFMIRHRSARQENPDMERLL